MAANNQCKMEFYFTIENIKKLLDQHPKAKGIIISQEIKVRRNADNQTINVLEIKARADNGGKTDQPESRSVEAVTTIDGCPQPPGCW